MTVPVLLSDPKTPPANAQPPLPPLLRLPPAIRRRIYDHLNLAALYKGKPRQFDLGGNRPGAPKLWSGWRGFHGVLLVCRLIHDEAVYVLYSSNRFSLYYCWTMGPRLLDPLLSMTAPALAALKGLKIVLNQAGCHHADPYDRFSQKCCVYNNEAWDACQQHSCGPVTHSAPLLGSGPDDSTEAMLSAWHSAAAGLSRTTAGRLELSLVCDVDARDPWAVQVARSVVQPLRALTRSQLKACHLRLSLRPDAWLQRMARDTVLHACDLTHRAADPSGRTWLMRLPAELRIRILEHTDLVTPQRQVYWSRYGGAGAYHADGYASSWACFEPRHGCLYHIRHSAFSAACRCWRPPGPTLFLICRALTRDAQFVFFSRNHFVVYDFGPTPPWELGVLGNSAKVKGGVASPYAPARLAVSEFLRDTVPKPALAHLRSLELTFRSSLPSNWPGTEHPAMQDWRETVEWLRGKVGARSLTLRLKVWEVCLEQGHYFRERYEKGVNYWDRDFDHTHIPEEAKPVFQAIDDLVRPLRALADDGLTRFFADLSYPIPLPGRPVCPTRNTKGYHKLKSDGRKSLEKRAERLVLGDRYGEALLIGPDPKRLKGWQDDITLV
ncbi:hypothetical protein C8A05DRAFT_20260 [Staphylotrichum tortipilum]|uniref:Uncharacterized protein n=1 Tax=Staphylotrichum tortipilum TaxID=2831512 RepID=A0AAN6M9S4_9PEZI|nr:hypothetical protein C8A05DRAFT_20260 [Staphylotrichum longicolle]